MLLMEAKEKGVTLDVEAEAFLANVECTAPYDQPLAMATTNIFEVNHEDAYDSDVDEGPNAAAASWPIIHPPLSHEMHHEEQSDSDVESELDDNTTPFSKKPKNASQDLHKDILGRNNPRYGKKAPVINASNAWDTDETLASAEVILENSVLLPANEIASQASTLSTPVTP
ncbi:hypothetical protein Tco_1212626 [Tanacetum coccineum]